MMIRRTAPWMFAGLSVVIVSCSFLLRIEDWPVYALTGLTLWIAVTGGVGALIVSRRRENPEGCILLAMAFFVALGLLTTHYAAASLEARAGALPGGVLAAWLQTWLFIPVAGLIVVLTLWFPTGRVPSPRWRWVMRIGVAGTIGLVVSQALRPGPLEALPTLENPLGIAGARAITDTLSAVSAAALAPSVLAALISVFLRFRGAKGDERQQVKWFTFAVSMLAISVLVFPLLETFGGFVVGESSLGFFVPFVGLLGVPVSIGLAILRYRLYDIDRIISRTVAYAIVTVILAGAFAIIALGPALVVGEGDSPDYVIAAATLIVAALFRPVRRRVQGFVDRRFNRSRYDATRTVERFSARLRQQVDLDALGAELSDLVAATVHPSHVSLWLRPPTARRP